jgi:hypothetical protein
VFPLTEGMTGTVVARRGPVWFERYDQVPSGHVADPERASLRGVIGVPLEWRGRVIGACIVFSRDEHRVFAPLAKRGINVRRNYVGNYCTSLDMAGCSITLTRLDDEITGLLAAPAEIAIRTL